ncbi:MAG: hypothetical protein K6F59_05270 [Gammaproteobacteria bacterium]|nr:hypothetical protein [Gammaproteobacteria bacterium]
MKKIIKLNIIIILILCFSFVTSCYTKKVNSFVAGTFVGEVDDIKYYFEVEEIEKETFENEWPVNVVHDMSYKKNKYYRLCLYYYENDKKIIISFNGLEEVSLSTPAMPLKYADKNEYFIYPMNQKNGAYEIAINKVSIKLTRAKE